MREINIKRILVPALWAFGLGSASLLGVHPLRAQDEHPRVWYDLKLGVAFESPGGSSAGNNTAGALSGSISRELTKSLAVQFAGDYFTAIFGSSGDCTNPFQGGCVTGATNPNFSAIGAAASIVITSAEKNAPKSDASLGVGYYSVSGLVSHSGPGFRATVDRTLNSGKRESLTIHGGLLMVPMGTGSPMSIITVGLGLRVW